MTPGEESVLRGLLPQGARQPARRGQGDRVQPQAPRAQGEEAPGPGRRVRQEPRRPRRPPGPRRQGPPGAPGGPGEGRTQRDGFGRPHGRSPGRSPWSSPNRSSRRSPWPSSGGSSKPTATGPWIPRGPGGPEDRGQAPGRRTPPQPPHPREDRPEGRSRGERGGDPGRDPSTWPRPTTYPRSLLADMIRRDEHRREELVESLLFRKTVDFLVKTAIIS
ncbi:MAG: hypothetical protein MZV70_18290 [Desulfobacterales bacterium]|nr:hypothetical protein [Desulfobacterales bacterium]